MAQSIETANRVSEALTEEQSDRTASPDGDSAADAHTARHDRRLDGLVVLALALFSLVVVVALLKAGVSVTMEDGYYYFKIAQNLAHGKGSTFDGLHPTNGYHPLWLLCLVPIFWLKTSPETAIALGTLLQGLLMAAGTVMLYFTARQTLGRPAASLTALIWLRLTYPLELSGLEFSLQTLGISTAAYLYVRWFREPNPPPFPKGKGANQKLPLPSERSERFREGGWGVRFLLGLILALTFLARLETILLAGILCLAVIKRERQSGWSAGAVRCVLALVGPIAVAFLLYVGINIWLFGHPFPVSSSIKSDWSAYLLAHDPLYREHGWLAAKCANLLWPLRDLRARYPLAIGAFGCPLLCAFARMGRETALWRGRLWLVLRPYAPFMLFSALQFLAAALLYHGEMSFTPWYYAVQPWLTALMAGVAFEAVNLTPRPPSLIRLLRRQGRGWRGLGRSDVNVDFPIASVARFYGFREFTLTPPPSLRSGLGKGAGGLGLTIALVVAWCLPPVRTVLSVREWQESTARRLVPQPLQTAALWIRSHLPPDAVIGSWNAGTIGYLSQRRVVNLDGLVNSWDYTRFERHDLCRYWQRNNITYVVDAFDGLNALALVPTRSSYARCRDRLELVWEDTSAWSDATYVWAGDGRPAHWRMAAYRIRPETR